MPARPHGTDEPLPGEPREPVDGDAVPGPGEDAERSSAESAPPDGGPDLREGTDAAPIGVPGDADLDDVEVASRWDALVTQLRSPADPRAWAPDPEVEEAEGHFQPPDPGPVLPTDPFLRLAWVAVVGVPLLVVLSAAFWPELPVWLLQLAGVAFVAGAVMLVRRLPRDRDEEDDPGSGAVV